MISYIQKKYDNICLDYVKTLLKLSADKNHFTNGGPLKEKLEEKLQSYLEIDISKRVVCVSSGTSALHLLIAVYEKKLQKELKWVTPSFNFPSAVVNDTGTTIIDIEFDGKSKYRIPLDTINEYDGLILPTLFGTYPDNFDDIITYCKKHNVVLILDNASSPLTKYSNTNICNLGDSSFGSLHHTKYMGFAEGGFLVISKEDYTLANRLSNFGYYITRDYDTKASNYKMSDIAAAFILAHLNTYSIFDHRLNQEIILSKIEQLDVKPLANAGRVVYGNLPLVFNHPIEPEVFRKLGIEVNKYYKPLQSFPHSDLLYSRILNFPLHASLTSFELDKMAEILEKYEDSR